jgi:hypothetical protein
MTTFHSQRSCDVNRTRKNANTVTFGFASEFPSSICTVVFTNGKNFGANIFTSRCSHTSRLCHFRYGHALPLSQAKVFRPAHSSPVIAQHPARRSRNGRAASRKTSGETSRAMTTQLPGNVRAVATAMPATLRQDDSQDNSRSRHALAVPQLAGQLARQSRSSPVVVRTASAAASHEQLAGCSPSDFNHDIKKL